MNITTAYGVRIGKDVGASLQPTVDLFRKAVDFFIVVIDAEWNCAFSKCETTNDVVRYSEKFCVATKQNEFPKYDFSGAFYKFPCYLRRAAISKAFGLVSSYRSNLRNWSLMNPITRGKAPAVPKAGFSFPVLYKDNCFIRTGTYTASIKAFVRNTWDWVDVTLRKTDVDYINRHCTGRKECVPTLIRKGKNWELMFPFEEKVKLNDTDVLNRRILAVDLGLNNAATCSVMQADGAVLGRHFLSLTKEYDSLMHCLNNIKAAQQRGNKRMPRLWALANGVNTNIANRTAAFIADIAMMYNCDVVVMEALNLNGKKKGGAKQRLALWRAKTVQRIVGDKVHRACVMVSTVCAWNTSRLAFDGSGKVLRGKESERTGGCYSVCEFQNGKIYNCDLNASYNIGARYFIREILGGMSERARSAAEAEVPSLSHRSTCTLCDLWKLTSVLKRAVAAGGSVSATSVETVPYEVTQGSPMPLKGNRQFTAVGSTRHYSCEASRHNSVTNFHNHQNTTEYHCRISET